MARLPDNNHIQEVCTVDVIGQSEKNSMSVQHVWSRVYSVYNVYVWTVRGEIGQREVARQVSSKLRCEDNR